MSMFLQKIWRGKWCQCFHIYWKSFIWSHAERSCRLWVYITVL